MSGGHRGLQRLLLLAVVLAVATGAAGGGEDDGNVEREGVCRNEPCASCGSDDHERKFLQAERLLRSVLQGTGDAEARESMHKRIRELLDHGGGRPLRRTPLAAEEKPDENLVLFNDEMMRQLREEVNEIFNFAFGKYMDHAYPYDELRPLACSGKNVFGPNGYRLTLIDSLDTFVVLGNISGFHEAVLQTIEEVTFDVDQTVSVFETNIRGLGGLLSAHFFAEELLPWYSGELLTMALDLGNRLLPAFNTKTGIPYGTVNLKKGVPPGETKITSAAGGGTVILEFSMLSRATGDPRFEQAAKRATQSLWDKRSKLGLVGNHINIDTGAWTHQDAGLGTNIDSFYEYLIKGYILLGDTNLKEMFQVCYSGIIKYLKKGNWYMDVNMHSGASGWSVYSSLANFWPGTQVLVGDVDAAISTQYEVHALWRSFGGVPEGFNLQTGKVHAGAEGYPLRPESIESIYYLHQATEDPIWLSMGLDVLQSLQVINRVPCGFAGTKDVGQRSLDDRMDSYFLSETVKYLYLLFDNQHWLRKNPYVFNTEGHPFPVRPDWLNLTSGVGEGEPQEATSPGGWEGGFTCKMPHFRRRISAYGFEKLLAEEEGVEEPIDEGQAKPGVDGKGNGRKKQPVTEPTLQLHEIRLDDRLLAALIKPEEASDQVAIQLRKWIDEWLHTKVRIEKQEKVWDADNLIGGRARYQEQIRDGSGAGSPAGMLVDPRDFFAFEKSCEGPPACHPDDTDVWVPECEGFAAKRMMDLHRGTGAWIEWGTSGTCGEGFYLRGKGKEATGEERDNGEERLAVARELARAMSGEGKGKEEAGSLFQKLFRGKRDDKVDGVSGDVFSRLEDVTASCAQRHRDKIQAGACEMREWNRMLRIAGAREMTFENQLSAP